MKLDVNDSILELRKDAEALKRLADLVELEKVGPEQGGYHFSDWERGFIRAIGELNPDPSTGVPILSQVQRDKIKELWQAADLRGRAAPDDKAQNLFSKLSPDRQAEQRARAAKVRLPWEK